jgi:hypothetical protein
VNKLRVVVGCNFEKIGNVEKWKFNVCGKINGICGIRKWLIA